MPIEFARRRPVASSAAHTRPPPRRPPPRRPPPSRREISADRSPKFFPSPALAFPKFFAPWIPPPATPPTPHPSSTHSAPNTPPTHLPGRPATHPPPTFTHPRPTPHRPAVPVPPRTATSRHVPPCTAMYPVPQAAPIPPAPLSPASRSHPPARTRFATHSPRRRPPLHLRLIPAPVHLRSSSSHNASYAFAHSGPTHPHIRRPLNLPVKPVQPFLVEVSQQTGQIVEMIRLRKALGRITGVCAATDVQQSLAEMSQ